MPRPPAGFPYRTLVVVTVSAFALVACIVMLQLAASAMMDLGGFLASGGPYEITHPAPHWSWIWPVSFVGIWLFVVLHAVFASRVRGFNLILPTWCALFLWAGISFLRHGFVPPGGGGMAWGWIVSGIVFLPIGAVPLLAFLPVGPGHPLAMALLPGSRMRPDVARDLRRVYYALHAVAVAGGAVTGVALFDLVRN